MHDNPQAPASPAFALPDHRLIALSGRDATAFAQAQFMSDINTLAPGHWHWSGWLTPKGRVVALFALLRPDPDSIWLLLPDSDPAALAAALQRFVFRSKVTIAVRDDLHVEGAFATPAQAVGNALAGTAADGIELDLGAEGGHRTLRIVPAPSAPHDAAAVARWAAFDMEHGLPRLPATQSNHWTPQQLSLERLNAYSVKKGCYPGQEIVARTHFLGKAKRRLALLASDAHVQPGEEVRVEEAPLGQVVAAASADDRHLALAVLPLDREVVAATVEGRAVREIGLRGGLER